MKFTTPQKSVAPSWLMTFLIFIPFIFQGKYPSISIKSNAAYKGQSIPFPVARIRQVSKRYRIIDPGNDVVSPPAAPIQVPRISPDFARFIEQIADGQATVVRGIYAAGILALHVVQQPAKDWSYVSSQLGNATEFQNAAQNGVIGLLAHNYLSGRLFYKLQPGDRLGIVYGDGTVKYYRVSGSYQYRKFDPNDLSSSLVDLSTGATVTSNEVFNRFYAGSDHVTLQTCLEKNGVSTWGLYFVVANPINPGY